MEKSSNTCSPFFVQWTVPLSTWVSSTDGVHEGSKGNFLEKIDTFLVVTDFQTS